MDKVQKIREEVERIINRRLNLLNGDYFDLREETNGFTNEIMDIIDSLQEEPASEELEEVAEDYALDDYIKPWRELVKGAFKDGSKWHKKQMMAKAVDGYVIEDIEEGNGDFLLSTEYLPKSMDLKDRQKVKVIVIKED